MTAKNKKPIASERQEQIALINWAHLQNIDLVHHANEGKRTGLSGHVLKAMGLSPGYPDLSLAEARGGYFGLFIEMKQNRHYSPSEQKTPSWLAQTAWLARLSRHHYFAIRCFGWDHAREIVSMYVGWPLTAFVPQQI